MLLMLNADQAITMVAEESLREAIGCNQIMLRMAFSQFIIIIQWQLRVLGPEYSKQ